jgi:kynurenine formamidase
MGPAVIDLSQELATGMQVFPLHSPTHVLPWARLENCGFKTEAIFCNSHAGTHVDAPSHFLVDGSPVDQLPLENFFGPAVVYDLSDKPLKSYIGAEEIARCEEQTALLEGDIVLFRTGIDRHFGKPEFISAYSALSEDGARYLAQRKVKAVGTDAPGIDHPDQFACPAHHVLLPLGIVIYENLANLEALVQAARGKRFTFHALPLKIRGATGSPVRAVAVIG